MSARAASAAAPGSARAPALLATALGASLPFSTALVSLLLAALLLLTLGQAGQWAGRRPWRHPVVALGLALFAWIAGHTLVTGGLNTASLQAINKYHELALPLLLLPAFWGLRAGPGRDALLRGLALGALLFALVHWVALIDPALGDRLESRRISAGWTLAVCAFLLLVRPPASGRRAAWWALAGFLALTVLVAVDGRTGHVTVLVLLPLAALLAAPARWRWPGALLVLTALAGIAVGSPQVQTRVQETVAGLRALDGQPLSATGVRVQLLATASVLAREHALLGTGLTRYPALHEAAALARLDREPQGSAYRQDSWVRSGNPHNEFLLQAVAFGLPALGLFIAWLAAAAFAGATPAERAARLGLVVAFAVGGLFNSLLLDFIEGHFFVVVLSWLLAQGTPDVPEMRA